MVRHAGALVLSLAISATAYAQGVDQKRIDDAIKKGVQYLNGAESSGWDQHINNCDELILLTLIHADVPEGNAKLQDYLKRVLEAKMERTYKVALMAMCLEELDRVKYQPKIKQCAQFLVDNQAQNGQWSYGEPTQFADPGVATGGPARAAVASGKEGVDKQK